MPHVCFSTQKGISWGHHPELKPAVFPLGAIYGLENDDPPTDPFPPLG